MSFLPSFDAGMLSQFSKAIEVCVSLLIIIAVGMILMYIIEWIIYKIYVRCANEKVQSAVTKIIYKLDEVADDMTNKEKRRKSIADVKDLFIWRSIPIPSFVIGVIIDGTVSIIRRLQKNTAAEKDPYLHPDELSNESGDPVPPTTPPAPPTDSGEKPMGSTHTPPRRGEP